MPSQKEKLLTDTELELMNILWNIGNGSVRDVMSKLPEDRNLAYTSVSTILRILEKKEILTSSKQGKTHIYSPVTKKEDYQKLGLSHLVNNVFSGEATTLVKALLETRNMKMEDLEEIKKLISNSENI